MGIKTDLKNLKRDLDQQAAIIIHPPNENRGPSNVPLSKVQALIASILFPARSGSRK